MTSLLNDSPFSGCCAQHIVYPLSDGSLLCFGNNESGQLGLGFHSPKVDVVTKLQIQVPIIQVSCGRSHTMMLGQDGSVWGMGDNLYGQVGIIYRFDEQRVLKPEKVNLMRNLAQSVSCGAFFTMILFRNGELYSCGANNHRQLGLGINNHGHHCHTKFQRVAIDMPIEKICCGAEFAIALDVYKYFYVWGNNNKGQLALPKEEIFIPVKKFIVEDIIDIACGGEYSMILTSSPYISDEKHLSCWGDNENGQLNIVNGRTKKVSKYTFTDVDDTFQSISCGFNHSVAVVRDEIYSCGKKMRIRMTGRISCLDNFTICVKNDVLFFIDFTRCEKKKNPDDDCQNKKMITSPVKDEEKIIITLECPVCLEGFNDKAIRLDNCGHMLCPMCAEKIKNQSGNCPLCRKPFSNLETCFFS